jgi:two-component system, chemotaxis family, chemotaxis protein CheY
MIKRVLIVDDSGVGRKLVRRCLEFSGLVGSDILEAENGQGALALLEAGGVDLLITDLNMPVMDGLELLRAIDEIPALKSVVKIMMTSASSDALKSEFDKCGVTAIISKPVSPAKFAKVIGPLMGRAR